MLERGGVIQALETLRNFGWSFHKKIVESSRWAEKLGGTHSVKLGGGQTLRDSRDKSCWLSLDGDVVVACPGWGPQPLTYHGNI